MIQVVLTRKVDGQGRILLPKPVRKKLGIQPKDRLVMTVKQGQILAEKQTDQIKEKRLCYITGIESSDCEAFSGGIYLSKKAAMELVLEIQSKR